MRTYPTRQSVFDAVWKHFVVDKNPKSIDDFGCCYSGTGCAIGCLIDDKDLCKELDNNGGSLKMNDWVFNERKDKLGKIFTGIPDAYAVRYLLLIQDAHDQALPAEAFHKDIEIQLRNIAKGYELTIP